MSALFQKGWTLAGTEKPLRISAQARGAFNQFVNVVFDKERNETSITGFSIDISEAAVKQLPHHLPYVFIPYYDSYDEMVAEVHNNVVIIIIYFRLKFNF